MLQSQTPVFDADEFPGAPIRKAGHVAGGVESRGGLEIFIHGNAAVQV